jgi:hypothetical protein
MASNDHDEEFALLESDNDASASGDSSGSDFEPSDGKSTLHKQTQCWRLDAY